MRGCGWRALTSSRPSRAAAAAAAAEEEEPGPVGPGGPREPPLPPELPRDDGDGEDEEDDAVEPGCLWNWYDCSAALMAAAEAHGLSGSYTQCVATGGRGGTTTHTTTTTTPARQQASRRRLRCSASPRVPYGRQQADGAPHPPPPPRAPTRRLDQEKDHPQSMPIWP
eukprot:COSAG01_NODE_2228_length_8130_cov_11.575395_2_plen_168_part_00